MATYDEILQEAKKIKSFSKKLEELNVDESTLESQLTKADLLNIISSQENLEFTAEIFINGKNKLGWKFVRNNSSKSGNNINAASINYVYRNFPDKMLSLDMKDLEKSVERKEIYKELNGIAKSIIGKKETKGIYIHGEHGVGKSYVSTIMLNKMARGGLKVAQIFMPEFVSYLKSMMSNQQSSYELLDSLKRVDVLLIDDLGAETSSSWTINDILLPIMNYRAECKLPTLFTSQFTIDQYVAKCKKQSPELGQQAKRLAERIKMNTVQINMKGENHRY